MTAVFFNPLQDGYTDDPWSHFAEMREAEPVHALLTGGYALFRYDDVFALLRDPEMSVDDRNANFDDMDRAALVEEFSEFNEFESILGMDPPDHTRLRRLVSKAFTPRTIEALRPRIEEMVDGMLDTMEEAGTADVVGELAFPLPFDVISEMLGLPEADKDQIRDWSGAIVKTLDPIITEDEMREAGEANRNLEGYLETVIDWKRANPADDILTAMIDAEESGDRMTPKELRDQVNLLFVAGHETTVNLIGTGIKELLAHPDQADLWRNDPSLDANAVDEMLRWVSPVQFSRRITLKDTEIDGVTVPAKSFVQTSLASANHDPAKFGPTAEQLDLSRPDAGQHVSFGSGIHYCLGASLAKLEGQVAIGRFLRRFPNAEPSGEPVWNGRINLRGLDRFLVRVQ
ncbi:MAG: cytochrome P450 [Acidimicrobiales bacterium]|nr:MAG: cytochrome P450 [Acidimicrobiales bacterium]